MQKRRCRFYRVPRLLAIVIPLKADCSADGCIVLRPAYAKLRGRARKVGSKAARFDDGDFYAERPDLFGQRLGKALDTKLRRCVRRASRRANASADRCDLDDVPSCALTEVRKHSFRHNNDAE